MEPTTGIQILRNSQKTLRGLFRQLEVVGRRAPEMKERVIGETLMMLEIHLDLEEEFIYPALKSSLREEDREIATQGLSQNYENHALIAALRHRRSNDEHFDTGALNLISTAEEHFQTENEKIFPAAENFLGSLLDEMGPRMEERREEHMNAPRYRGFRPYEVQNPHGGEQKRKATSRY